jgi:hypothetical protein
METIMAGSRRREALGNDLGLLVALGNDLGLLVALGNDLGLLVSLGNVLCVVQRGSMGTISSNEARWKRLWPILLLNSM